MAGTDRGDMDKDRDERQDEARRILNQIKGETDPTGIRTPRSMLGRAEDHFAGRDAPADDPVELWGRRIGRFLGLVLLIVLIGLLWRMIAGASA